MNQSNGILFGEFASKTLKELFKDRKSNKSRGYFFKNDVFVAFDNSTYDCWVEEFEKEEMAICWLEKYFEISERNDFQAKKINRDLLSIRNIGYLKLKFENNTLKCSELSTLREG